MKIRLAMVTAFPKNSDQLSGGVESAASCLVVGLRQFIDVDIHIVSPTESLTPTKEYRDGITIHWLPMPKGPAFLSYWSMFRRRVHDCLREISPDITHFQGVAGWTLGYNDPYVLTIHGISEKGALYSGGLTGVLKSMIFSVIENAGRRRAKNIIIISPYVRDVVSRQLRGRCWSIENPVTEDFFQVHRKKESPNILYVGRVSRLKNVDGLLGAFKRVVAQYPDARLRIAGKAESSAYQETCKQYVVQNGIEHAVHFLGNLDRQSLLKELAETACLVLISHQETAPMVIEEAMAASVPVVASRICGIPYMVEDGVTGFVVDPDNEKEVASRLGTLLVDFTLNQKVGEESRNVARIRFHNHEVARRTLEVYRTVCNQMQSEE